MLRRVLLIAAIVAFAAPAAAQAQDWQVRNDQSQSASDPDNTPEIQFTALGTGGFRYVGGPAGTLWMPSETATGNYTLSATFTLNEPSSHTTYYGLVFGGSNLDAANQQYLYFLVAQDGTFLIKRRDGEGTSDIQSGTDNGAVMMPSGAGRSANTLEVRISGDTITYVVNRVVVHTTPKTGATAVTDGIVGARINHVTNVTVSNFRLVQQ